jgi:hypothetical protein
MKALILLLSVLLLACPASETSSEPVVIESVPGPTKSHLWIKNQTEEPTIVYVAFGADSGITQKDWSTFCKGSGLTCSFKLGPSGEVQPFIDGYLNATIAFGAPVACGSTKAELNVNNPKWYDVLDVSLVDGYSNKVKIMADDTQLGPPAGKEGNEKVVGVFPLGCDICTARQSPPCGQTPGKDGCKSGTQYKPDVPCQWQGTVMGGGTKVMVSLVK